MKKISCFSDLLPDPIGNAMDLYFQNKGWELWRWDTGAFCGYQVFFGSGVQVDNLYEYGFPYLLEEDELITFAKDFYNKRVAISEEKVPRVQLWGLLGVQFDLSKDELETLLRKGTAAEELLLSLIRSDRCVLSGESYFPPEPNEKYLCGDLDFEFDNQSIHTENVEIGSLDALIQASSERVVEPSDTNVINQEPVR